MSAKIGLISDLHAAVVPLREALTIFQGENVDLVLCAGDIAGYGTELNSCVELLLDRGARTILGNHDIWCLEDHDADLSEATKDFLGRLALTWKATLEGNRLLAVHASPPRSVSRGITLLDQYENILVEEKQRWALELAPYKLDVLIVGHTHQVFAEMLGQTLVINPGSTRFNHSCAVLRLPSREVQFFPLSGKTVRRVWHWGLMSGAERIM